MATCVVRQVRELASGSQSGETDTGERRHDGIEASPQGVEARVVREIELIRRCRVDQPDPGHVAWILLCIDERVDATDGVAGEHIRAGDTRDAEELVQVGRELIPVLASRRGTTPALAGSIEGADAGCR